MKIHHRTALTLAATAFAFALAVPAVATARTYLVGGDDKNTNITFESESEFETILGTANQAHGSVVADLAAGTGEVEVAVPVEALRTGIELRDKHLKSADWLDAKRHPEIRFRSRQVTKLDETTWRIEGDLTFHGVTRPLAVEAKVRAIDAELAKVAGLGKGDWLRVVAPFEVALSEFGVVVPEKVAGRVGDRWKIRLNLFAQAQG